MESGTCVTLLSKASIPPGKRVSAEAQARVNISLVEKGLRPACLIDLNPTKETHHELMKEIKRFCKNIILYIQWNHEDRYGLIALNKDLNPGFDSAYHEKFDYDDDEKMGELLGYNIF